MHPCFDDVHRDVGVAEHDEVGGGEASRHPSATTGLGARVVDHREPHAVERQFELIGSTPGADVLAIVVSHHDADRCELGQFVQHRWNADISCVQDQVTRLEFLPQGSWDSLPSTRSMGV